jgi:hypothetical protein
VKPIAAQERLAAALLDPPAVLALGERDWNDLLFQARVCVVLARLGVELDERGLLERIPPKAQDQIGAARISAESSRTAVRFEINRVVRALASLDVPIVLLKGAAYMMAGLPPARGRFVGDLDLMVPRDRIDEVERTLVTAGWAPADLDEYDERYYREWAHEIPPLLHPQRETPLDIHHSIAPLTSRVTPDAGALIASSVPLADSRLRVLAPADMVLHSTVHLFNDEVGKPLRDLFDLHDLLCHFGTREAFWNELLDRARLHGLGRPLYYMLRCTRGLLGSPVPAGIVEAAEVWAPAGPVRAVMDRLFARYFAPEPPERPLRAAALARGLLYLRAHWLRMPPAMLGRHLVVKATRRARERLAQAPREADDEG